MWLVHTKGSFDKPCFEIAVVRKDNIHGIRSYGWFGKNKILICSSGGPCDYSINKRVWDKLITVAQEVSEELNNDRA